MRRNRGEREEGREREGGREGGRGRGEDKDTERISLTFSG
jgi:hypothetical protein